jgi:hypothetical protein
VILRTIINRAAVIEQLRQTQETLAKLLALLEAGETEFAAHLYQSRTQYLHTSERPNMGNKAIERQVLSSYQIAPSLGFNGDFRAWERAPFCFRAIFLNQILFSQASFWSVFMNSSNALGTTLREAGIGGDDRHHRLNHLLWIMSFFLLPKKGKIVLDVCSLDEVPGVILPVKGGLAHRLIEPGQEGLRIDGLYLDLEWL